MKNVSVYEAKTHLSELIRLVLQGEDVVISRGKKPVVRLVALPEAKPQRQIGLYPQAVKRIAQDFNAPLQDFEDYMS